jgi:putative ABC transport system substrate-binding protein
LIQGLEAGLAERGYEEGRNLIIEHRFADFRPDQLLTLAAELASLHVDVLVTGVNRNAVALQQATDRTPIVMAVAEDPVTAGLVKSLARPGGNVTGVTVPGPEIFGKNLELLKEALPKGARVAVLFNVTSPINARYLKATEESARKLRIRLLQTGVRSVDDFAGAFAAMKQEQALGLLAWGSLS